jgi:hypothetical protein
MELEKWERLDYLYKLCKLAGIGVIITLIIFKKSEVFNFLTTRINKSLMIHLEMI